jgi:enamine deaminase RidA (YjgF/YER057c/UK114 family)
MSWALPLPFSHRRSGSTDSVVSIGGTGDFDSVGKIRHPDAVLKQIDGALANLEMSLADEVCTLGDVVRVKAFCTSANADEHWQVTAALARLLPADPAPVIIVHPVPLQPFQGQKLQLQALAIPGWRSATDNHVVESKVPEPVASLFDRPVLTQGLRAGEFIALAGQSALTAHASAPNSDGIAQTHETFARLDSILEQLGASFQDAIKKEGYYFGTTMEQWAAMAEVRATYFREPGPVATVVPCHQLWPQGLLTRVELLAMRATRSGFNKYIAREDCWPDRVWDWPIPVPYRQGIRLRNTIWTGGQVAFEPGTNSGKAVHPGNLNEQTRLNMRYIDDILRGFGATTSDLQLLVCYFESDGLENSTVQFAQTLADCVAGPLPPLTLIPQPKMHSDDMTVEIWGISR